jgi:hypothetical protein
MMIRRVEGRPSPCGASPRRTNRDCESATSRLFLCVCVRAYVCDTVHDGTAYPSSAVRSQILHTALSLIPQFSYRNTHSLQGTSVVQHERALRCRSETQQSKSKNVKGATAAERG